MRRGAQGGGDLRGDGSLRGGRDFGGAEDVQRGRLPRRAGQCPYLAQQRFQKRRLHRLALQPGGEARGDVHGEAAGVVPPALGGGLLRGVHGFLGGVLQRLGLLARLGQQRGAGCGGLGLGGGQYRLTLLGEAGAGFGDFGQRRLGRRAFGSSLVQQGLRGGAALFDHPRDGAPEEARQQPDEDEDVEGLQAKRPPVDAHGVTSAAGSRTAAAAR